MAAHLRPYKTFVAFISHDIKVKVLFHVSAAKLIIHQFKVERY